MATITIELPDSVWQTMNEVVESRGGTANNFAVAAISRAIQEEKAVIERITALCGKSRSAAEVDADFRARHSIPDLSHLSSEELVERAEAILSKLPPEQLEAAKRAGFL